ncbi:MAG: HAD-IIA family hydrolase [Capsulimonadaceae bacterium]
MFTRTSIYVFDLDGVLYLGDSPIPHAADAVRRLESDGHRVYFLTNNSGQTRAAYQTKLRSVNGLDVPLSRIFTSAYATALFLQQLDPKNGIAFVIGEAGLAADLETVGGLKVVTAPGIVDSGTIDYVVVGIDRKFTYDKLRFAHEAIVRGHARFIATNRDATYPMEEGPIPGAGSIVASVATAVGAEPIAIGKPEPHAYEAILREAGVVAADCTMVGDRLDTDILGGRRAGGRTVLVLTGVSSRETVENAPKEWQPDIVLENLSTLA